jgi:hypothetical protein
MNDAQIKMAFFNYNRNKNISLKPNLSPMMALPTLSEMSGVGDVVRNEAVVVRRGGVTTISTCSVTTQPHTHVFLHHQTPTHIVFASNF